MPRRAASRSDSRCVRRRFSGSDVVGAATSPRGATSALEAYSERTTASRQWTSNGRAVTRRHNASVAFMRRSVYASARGRRGVPRKEQRDGFSRAHRSRRRSQNLRREFGTGMQEQRSGPRSRAKRHRCGHHGTRAVGRSARQLHAQSTPDRFAQSPSHTRGSLVVGA